MAKLGSLGRKKSIFAMGKEKFRPNVVSIGMKYNTPAQNIKFHRKGAVASLRKNDFVGYRYHSSQVAKINTGLVISRMRKRKK